MEASRHMAVRELDLSNWHANTAVADRLHHAVPAIKSSAAFLTFLRANLVLDASAASYSSTPVLQPTPDFSTPSPSSQLTDAHLEPLHDIPDITLEILTHSADKKEALGLIAESINQQRKQVALSIAFHPVNIIALIGTIALALGQAHTFLYGPDSFHPAVAIAGFLTAYLIGLRYITNPYTRLASALSLSFLRPECEPFRPGSSHGKAIPAVNTATSPFEDLVVAARSGKDIVGALVLRLEPKQPHIPFGTAGFPAIGPPSSSGGKRRSKGSSGHAGPLRGGKGVVRAWTTARLWRHRGTGTDLLREAVRITRERCGRDAEVGFAREHANSKVVLPEVFNRWFRKQERRAAMALEDCVGEWDALRKKR